MNQAEADRDIEKLLWTPAAWRGISAEPLLGPIDFTDLGGPGSAKSFGAHGYSALWAIEERPRLDWIIVGGEPGYRFRLMVEQWALDIMDQCAAAGTSFHFKQHAGVKPKELGRLLAGREHNGMPPETKPGVVPSLPAHSGGVL